MIQNLSRFGWRVGMILIFAVPALYLVAGIAPTFSVMADILSSRRFCGCKRSSPAWS